jgi:urea transport system ATP-binding protein
MFAATNLSAGYGQSAVIPHLSFSAGQGEVLAIMGRNGMGKTTLFKALMGVLPARRGSIKLDGDELSALESFQRVRRGLAYVPQGRMIFPALSVLENIRTGMRDGAAGVPQYIYALFPVLYEMRKRKGGNLSGGQQQQLAIARALVTNPKVILLDEPTEGIQPSVIKDIARILKEIRRLRNVTIIVSEQVLSFALEIADRLLVIDKGTFIHEDLRENVDTATIARYLSV